MNQVPPLKIVLPPMSSASSGEKESNSNDVSATVPNSAKAKQLPYIVNSPIPGMSLSVKLLVGDLLESQFKFPDISFSLVRYRGLYLK